MENVLQCKLFPAHLLENLNYVVVCSWYKGQWLFSRKKGSDAWETQGGHIEPGETPEQAARRELYEESGVQDAALYYVCDYMGYDAFGFANGAVFFADVNALGVLYIVESGESVSSVADLRGRTIYASGKGATPEYALNYILSENGVDPEKDVNIEWKSEHAECLAALLAEENAVAMLPQPFVTTAQMKNDKIKVRLDLNAEWDAVQAGSDAPSQLITGVVAARKAFIEENPEAVAAFMESYAASVEFVNANVDEAAELIGKYEIVPAAVAKKAIPACNITFLAGGEMRQALSGYLNVLFEQNPKAVGGALPGEDFYYGGN